MEIIKDHNRTLAIIYRDEDWNQGSRFITPGEIFIQVGAWCHEGGKKIAPHIHKLYDRKATRTHELICVKRGSIKILFYDDNRNFKEDRVLKDGDLAVLIDGAHGFEVLEDDTQILEAKNGPFASVEKDKEKF